MGPLSRLRLFGFICPCHESDVEYNARVGVNALQGIPIQWYRTSSHGSWEQTSMIVLDAVMSIVDTKHDGPCLQVVCRDASRLVNTFPNHEFIQMETPKETLLRIPLAEIATIDLVETEYHSEIHVHSAQHKLLLQFCIRPKYACCWCVPPPRADIVVTYLQAVLDWDVERRRDVYERNEQRQAAQRLRDERRRLVHDEQAARMAIV